MLKKNIVLIIGQNKKPKNFIKSLNIYLNNKNISKIVIVTWKYTTGIKFNSSKVLLIRVPEVKCKQSFEYQKKLFDIGIKSINKRYNGDIYILKTRMDIIINNHLLDFIFNQNYKIDSYISPLFKYKIWIAWIHLTKPFYIGDCCFYSHISVMNNIAPKYSLDNKYMKLGQGHVEIRWFFYLYKLYNIYENSNEFHKYKNMEREFKLDDKTKKMLLRYKDCIKKHFIIQNLKEGIILKDFYNQMNYYYKHTNNILDIMKHNQEINNKKFAYNMDDFNNTFESPHFI